MKSDEIPAIEGKPGALLNGGKRQDLGIGQGLTALAAVVQGKYVVAERASGMDDGLREVFVSQQCGHQAASSSAMAAAISTGWARA